MEAADLGGVVNGSLIQFREWAIADFVFLEEEYGFVRVNESETSVEYFHAPLSIRIIHDRRSSVVTAEFRWFPDDIGRLVTVNLGSVIAAFRSSIDSPIDESGEELIAETPDQVKLVLAKIARMLKELEWFLRRDARALETAKIEFLRQCQAL